MVYGSRRLDALGSLLFLVLFCRVFQTTGVRVGQCPDLSRKFSQRCPPDTIDQCKYDEDCTENNKQKCCKIGCGKICFNPGDLALISGNSVCPVLPRPNPCPNEPNQCLKRDECVSGKECCSDGCRMICVQPVVVPTKEPAERKSCSAIVDVAFIIDSSGSISRRNYGKIKAFVKGIAGRLGISTNGSRAGIILYSTKASVKAYFNDSRTIEEFKRKVDELPHERGLTYINKALELASSKLFSRARKDVPKVAMLLTDGEQSKPESTLNLRDASAPLRQQGVRVIAFGIGKRINVRELRLTVERDEDVIRVMKFDDLVTKVGNYTNSLCEAAVTEPIHPDADIIFLMDSSVGVSREQLILQQQFVRRLARYFIISPLGPRGALVTYDRASFTVIGFSDYGSTADFSLKINDARLRGGSRRIDQALNYATKMFQDTGREGLRIVILLTAGNYYSGPGADTMSSVVMRLRSIDAHLYVIGIGSQFTPSVFTQMVRKPRDIFQVASFHDLEPWQSRIARTLRHTSNAFKYEPADFRSDIIFLMDSSRFVTKENYILEKNYVKLMARLLNLANNRSRAALYAFSDRPSLQITFDGYEDREAFDTAVNSASHLQGARRIDRAFEAAAELLRIRSRSSVPKYVILLTTGRQSQVADMRSLRETSQQIRTYGGRVFVVAILTGGYTVRDFWQAVQRPEDAMSVPSFINLLPRASFMASRIMATWRAPEAPTFAADIAFILDSSSAVTPFQYTRAQRFVRILSEYLNISPGKSRGSLITVGDSPIVNFNFDGYNTHAEFRTLVTDASYLGGSSSITSALRTAATMFTGARRSYPWLVILVTPWRPRDIRDTRALEAAASPLLKRGIWLYVLSVSENPYVGWLRPVVVEPRDAFSVVSYRDLPANIGSLAGYITADNYLYGGSKFLLDIIFLIDSSSGINSRDYSIEKWFVQRIAMHLGVFQGETVAGVVTYGGNASVVFPLGGYRSNSEFIRRLNDAPSMGGVRQIDRALDTAAALLLRSRSTLPKAVVLITAGDQSTAPGTIPIGEASRPLRQLGAWVYVTAIGRMDVRELQKVTIRPTDMFFASSFPGLYGFVRPVGTYVANTSVITGTSSLNADIVFIIDCSSSVPYREYQTQKDFVKSLAQYLNIQPGLSRVALVVYGSRAMPVLRFDSSRTIERFYSELAKTPYLGGPRNVDRALTMVMQRIFVDARENVPKIVLLFMAGKQSGESGSLRDSVRPLHLQGIRTFIFRIGSEPALRELHAAVDLPGDVFEFASFADLDSKTAPYLARHIPFSSAFLGPLSLAVEVVYLIDSSASVTSQHYNDQKTFVKQLSRFLNKMPGRTRVAVITYGSTATVISNFGGTSTTQEFYNALDNAPKVGGPRRMDRAVDKARTALAKARPAVPKVVILLTAGNQQAGIQASILDTSFKQLYNLGARLYAVTISPRTFLLPLRGTAGSDWFPVRNFIDLPRHVVPLSRYVAHDTAALGPYNFVADVIFMLDSSSSVTPDEFLREKEFIKLIARYLNITPGKSRGSVIIFSTEARPILPFDGYTEITGFNSVIDRTPQMSGTRRIDRAFNAAATLFQNSRPSVHRVAILLTGGRQSPDGGSLVDAMQLMKNRDVITYVIAVGGESDVPVQRPQDMFRMASYNDLPRQVQTIASTITAPRDPCATRSCNAPYSEGCRALNNRAQCICPTCSNVLKPICASDGVQDQSECNMKQQACRGNIWVNVTKEGPCDKECSPLLDIAFIIDSSGSIGRMNWERTKRFVKAVISKLEVSPSAAHVAAISYSTNPRVVLRFNSFQGTLQVNQVFDDMRWERGYTYTDKALLLADSELFQTSYGMRSNAKKIAIVITDGKQTTTSQYTRLSEASRGIKNKGVIVYAIGVGSGVDQAELEEIASGLDYVFTSSSFESLQNEASKIRKSVCEVSKPDPCLTTPCNAPYNLGCKVVDNTAQCICPTCPNILKPVCASDGVEDLSECHLERQACQGNVNVSVAKRTSCDKDCRPIMDIAFIIDSSGSIGSSNWERMKRFLKALVSKLDVSASATHVAAVAYSTNPQVVMTFSNFQGTSQVNQVLDFMRWQRGLTYTDKALQLADRELFQTAKGMRSSVPKVAFVITDGKQTTTGSYTQLSVASQGMKRKGVTVYALGVGSGVDRAELEQIASGSQNVYTSASFKDLKNIAGGIRHRFCRAYVTGPSTTPTQTTPDPCAIGCTVPFNEGCRVVNNTAQCICPTCRDIVLPVCATDGVQDQSDCHMRRQACQGDIGVTVAKQGTCDKECRNVVDIAFVIDSSGSIGRKNWERMRRFLKALVSKLDVDSSATHIAAIAYSTKPKVEMKFDGLQSTNQVNRLFDRMLWQRGVTYTDKALLLANKEVFQTSGRMRLHVPKLAIVVTDGKQTKVPSYTRLSVASQGMKDKGVIVYAVGVGRGANREELEEIASGSQYVLTSSSFQDLQNLAPEMIRRLCEHKLSVSTPPPTTTQLLTTPDPCQTTGCRAPYNIGCRVADNKAECICPTCQNTYRPVCATDGVQDLNECYLKQQACRGDIKGVTVAKQEPCDKECSAVVDIAFVIDSSGSIGRKNWEKMKRFLKALVSKLDVRRSATHIAAVAYSNNAVVVTRFSDIQSTIEVNRKLDEMRWQRGFTYTDKALLLADRDLFQTANGMRSRAPKLAFVITDGNQTTSKPYTKLSVASQGMKNKGVTVYALGVGNKAARVELLEISSGPQYVFSSSSFEELQKLVSLLTREFCEDRLTITTTVPTPPSTTPPLPTTPDLCQTTGCRAPYNIGCRVVDNKVECICPACQNIYRPVCATDGVQDLNECYLRQQACQGDIKGVTVAKQEPCDKECSAVVDIAFVIDSSGSIGRKNWEKMKRFLKALVSKLDVRRSATHIAAVAYSNNAVVVTRFSDIQSTIEVNRKLDEMRWQRGFTYTDKALLLADRDLFQTANGMRWRVPKLAFVITDGNQTTSKPYTKLSVASQGMKNKGVTVYALGVGNKAARVELLEISSGPQYVFSSSSFEELQKLVSLLTREFCEDRLTITTTVPTPPSTTPPLPTTPDPCQTTGCRAPYNRGCRVVENQAECICPLCPDIRKPVCSNDGVQDKSLCNLFQQSCLGNIVAYSVKTGPCDKDCRPLLDMAFIVDSSASIGKTNWERTKRFLKALVSKLDVSPGRTHVAAVAYSTDPTVIMRFKDVQDTDGVNRVLDGMRWQRGLTYTDKALQLADRDILQTSNGMRPNIAKIVIVITDGKQTKDGQYTSLPEVSERIKKKGVTMYSIGIGNGVDRNELEEIASSPDKVLTPSSFGELQAIAPQMRKAICQDPEAKYLADVIFLMDASSGTASTYTTEKDLVKSLARYLNIDPKGTRAALIVFNGRPSVISDFESFRSLTEFESKVDEVPHYGGDRSVSDALREAAGMFPKSPSSVSKVIFLVTSGKPLQPQDKNSAGDVINELSAIGVRTYLALVGPSAKIQDFRFLVDKTESVFTVESNGDVPKQVNQVGSYILSESVAPKKLNLSTYVLFVLDSSKQVTPVNFRTQKEFVKSMMSRLNLYPGESDSRVGLMVYSEEATVLLNIDNRESKSALERIVDNLPHLKKGRRIDRALEAATNVLKDVGTDNPKFVILVTAGRQEPDAKSFAAAVKPLHQTGTKTHIFAVGGDVDPSYFQGGDKAKTKIFSVPSFTDLPQKTAMLTEDLLKEYVAPQSTVATTTTAPIQTTPGPTDGDSPSMDIVFIVDTSNRVTQSDLEKQKEFVKLMAQRFDVSPFASHAAVFSYGDKTILIGGLYDHVRGKRFEDNVDSVTLLGGKRNIQEALKEATDYLAIFGRQNASNVVFLITYGRQSPELGSQRLQEIVQNVRDTNAILYVIGVGVDADDQQLGLIVESTTDFFEIPRSGDLKLNVPSIVYYTVSRAESKTPEDYKAEVIFVMDSSSLVGQVNYRNQKDFIKGLVRALNHSPNYTQSAVIIYDTFPEFAIRMGAYPEIGPFSHTVDKLRYLGGLSGGLDWALRFAPRGFSQDEPDVPKIIVLIATTDSQNPANIDSLSATLRRQDINITVLGIGSESNFPNIRRLVARPEDFVTPKASEYLPSYVPTVVSAILSGSANLTTDGGWGPWNEWSKCSRTCGTGLRIRERRCDSPRPQNGGERCQGPSQQLRNCKIEACPVAVTTPAVIQTTPRSTVHGGWGPWSGWSRCSRTCGKGSQIQERKCDSPRPQNGGRQCQGLSQQSRECKIRDCPVHGGWSPWDKWSRCTKTCGTGLQTQKRRCDSPRPTSGGRQCEGPSQQTRACSIRSCEDPEGYCPPYSPTKRCLGLVQDECTCDSDCNDVGDYKCCFDGCRRMCRSTAAQVCTASVDIIYLMDSSVSAGDFEKQRDFVRDLARIFSLGASRAAVVTYDDKATARINFDDFDSTFEFANAIDRISQIQTQGGSRIDLALKKTSDMFKSARINVPKVLIALTNGSHTEDSMALNQPVQLLRDQNVRIFAVGIGSNVDINKLKSLVESDADAFLVDLFVDLLRKSQTFADNTCSQISNSTKCVQGVDIAFLMDSSESITDEDFEREKIAVKEIAGLFLSASPDSRVGVIMYSGRPELMVDFLSQNSISEFESAVDDLTHKRSMTRIDSALRFAAQTLFLNPRRSVSSVAVVMTDGIQTPGPGVEPLDTAVLPLREKGVRVLAVGVGPRVDRSELKDLVTSQDDVFLMSSFQDLLNKSAELLEVVCPQPLGAINKTTANTTNTTPNTTRATTTSTPIMTNPTTAEPVRCDKLLDVVFVMDSSRSIDEPQYRQEKDFVKRLADIFKIGAGSRAAVIIYSDETQLEITFDQYSNLSSFLSAVESLPYLQRRTRIDKALTMTAQVLEQARPGFPKVVIVMTDGRQTRDPDALDLNVAAKPIHDQGVRVLVVGIGPEISDDELRLIARDSSYVFKVETFENLKKATQDVASTACINPTVTQAPKPKPGTCPFYPIRIRCAVTTNACLTDNECPGNLKCCYDSCRSICTLPDYEETTTPSFIGYCPAPTNPPDGVCPSGRSSCYFDDDCSSGYKCCLDGCGFSCQPAVDGPTTAPPPQCSESFDLVFAMDSSGSIGKDNYRKEKNFINGLANKLVVGPRNVHLGLIVFSDSSIVWLNFGTPTSTNYSSFSEAAVDNAPYLRGRTRIDSALQTAGDVFPEGRQNQEPQVLILITDGRQSNDPGSVPLKTAVQPLRDQGVKIIIVGIGEDVDEIELKSIVENADDELFLVGSFLELEPLLRNKKLNDAICLQTIGGRRQRNFS